MTPEPIRYVLQLYVAGQTPRSVRSVANIKRICEKYLPGRYVLDVFDLRPAAIIRDLDLLRPIYAQTAAYGHFGRELPDFTWESTDRVDALRAAV